MRNVIQWLSSPTGIVFLTVLVKEAVASMPKPLAGGSRFYLWFFGFAQLAVINRAETTISLTAAPANPPAPAALQPPRPPAA